MPTEAPKVVPVPGVKVSKHRGLAYVIYAGDIEVDARAKIEQLWNASNAERQKVWARFDYWINGGVKDEYFHGWNETGYRHCFVFKWNAAQGMQRLYGVLIHPKPQTNRGFVLCVLFSHAVKHGKHTDPAKKKKAEELYRDASVVAAIGRVFPDK